MTLPQQISARMAVSSESLVDAPRPLHEAGDSLQRCRPPPSWPCRSCDSWSRRSRSVARTRYTAWVPLGRVNQFPEGETRLATFRNPFVTPTDGKTADTACWVRRIEGRAVPGLRDQLRAPRLPGALVSPVAASSCARATAARTTGRFTRVRTAGARPLRIPDSRSGRAAAHDARRRAAHAGTEC